MEPVYRRGATGNFERRRPNTKKKNTRYKAELMKQAVLCLLVFVGCLFVNFSQNPNLEVVKNSVELIIKTNTDFKKIPSALHQTFLSLLPNQETENIGEKELLTALQLPVEAPITSSFGLRTHPADGTESFHYGVDLGAASGEKIKCVANGQVESVTSDAEYGNHILVRHSDTIVTLYAHCSEILPEVGDQITKGQVIATVGATGNTTGPHLHFEIRDENTWLDPAEFLTFPPQEDTSHD